MARFDEGASVASAKRHGRAWRYGCFLVARFRLRFRIKPPRIWILMAVPIHLCLAPSTNENKLV